MPGCSRSMHMSVQPFKPAAASVWRRMRASPPQACHPRATCVAHSLLAQPTAVVHTSSSTPLHLTGASSTGQRFQPFGAQQHAPMLPAHGVGARHRLRPAAALPGVLSSLYSLPYRDYIVVALAAVGAVTWVKIFDVLASTGKLEQKLSRKVVHTTTGPIFVLTWILFSSAPSARFLAAAVPLANFARLFAVGTGLLSDPGLVKSVSRSGDRGELLKGPLYYVVTLIAATILCWRDNPAGLIAVSMMCGGDGLADIVGRRWGGAKLPYNPAKSWAGSAAMLAGGYVMSYGLIRIFCSLGFFACYPSSALLSSLGTIALAATIVESLPINQYVDDNVSVPGVAAALSLLLLPLPVDATAVAAQAAELAAAAAAPAPQAVELAAVAATASITAAAAAAGCM